MFSTLIQKVSFVVGGLYLVVVVLSELMHLVSGNVSEAIVSTPILLGILAIFWHFTGVLKPVITWFKGK